MANLQFVFVLVAFLTLSLCLVAVIRTPGGER